MTICIVDSQSLKQILYQNDNNDSGFTNTEEPVTILNYPKLGITDSEECKSDDTLSDKWFTNSIFQAAHI